MERFQTKWMLCRHHVSEWGHRIVSWTMLCRRQLWPWRGTWRKWILCQKYVDRNTKWNTNSLQTHKYRDTLNCVTPRQVLLILHSSYVTKTELIISYNRYTYFILRTVIESKISVRNVLIEVLFVSRSRILWLLQTSENIRKQACFIYF